MQNHNQLRYTKVEYFSACSKQCRFLMKFNCFASFILSCCKHKTFFLDCFLRFYQTLNHSNNLFCWRNFYIISSSLFCAHQCCWPACGYLMQLL